MKIAGVGVNETCLPSREDLIEKALKTKEFYRKPNALKLIEAEIDASGLFNTNKNKARKSKSSRSNRKFNTSK